MNDRLNTLIKENYDYKPTVNKLRMLHALNQPDASGNIQLFLASEFRNLPMSMKVEMSQTAIDAADIPYFACIGRPFSDDLDNDITDSELILCVIPNKYMPNERV